MKRGFLTTSKAKKAIEKAVPDKSASSKSKKITVETSHAPVAETGVPKGYTSSKSFQGYESNASTLDYDPYMYILTTVPSVERGSRLEDVPGGWAEALVSGHVKRAIYSAPGFPRAPLSPTGGKAYRISEAGEKGLGMFATRLIRAGDLIIDERPMLFVPNSNAGSAYDPKTSLLDFTPEEQRRIVLHEQEKVVQMAFDRMPPENQKAFMTMANSHELDGSGPLVGRIRTNGFGCEGLRDKDATGRFGRYSAICKDTTRINHSCTPNTTRHWNTSSFSLRTYAVCDILPGTEITLAYCHPFDSAAKRAKDLSSYGITSCGCGPSCDPNDERSKIGDERRAAFKTPIILSPGIPGIQLQPNSEPEDAWVQPAVKRLAELEEEGLSGAPLYQTTLYQLVNAYTLLQDVEKVLMYADKLKGPYKAHEEKELSKIHLSEEEIRASPYWMMAEMRKIPGGMPVLVAIA